MKSFKNNNYKYVGIAVLLISLIAASCDTCKDGGGGTISNLTPITEEMVTTAQAAYTPFLADMLRNLKDNHQGVDVNAYDVTPRYAGGSPGKITAIHIAAELGNTDIVRALLDRGANVNAIDGLNYTPLHIAAREGHLAVVQVLLAMPGVDFNKKGDWNQTPLYLAAEHGRVDVVKE